MTDIASVPCLFCITVVLVSNVSYLSSPPGGSSLIFYSEFPLSPCRMWSRATSLPPSSKSTHWRGFNLAPTEADSCITFLFAIFIKFWWCITYNLGWDYFQTVTRKLSWKLRFNMNTVDIKGPGWGEMRWFITSIHFCYANLLKLYITVNPDCMTMNYEFIFWSEIIATSCSNL